MRQTILALVALLAIVQVVLAQQVLENGNYRIYYGNYQVTCILPSYFILARGLERNIGLALVPVHFPSSKHPVRTQHALRYAILST